MVDSLNRKRRRSVAEVVGERRKSLRAAQEEEGIAESVVLPEHCETELALPEQCPHADERLISTDTNFTTDELKEALTFHGVYVVPEAVKNALDALKRASCGALPYGVPVLRALELARSLLHAATTLLGAQVPIEQIPRIARHAVAAVSDGENNRTA